MLVLVDEKQISVGGLRDATEDIKVVAVAVERFGGRLRENEDELEKRDVR